MDIDYYPTPEEIFQFIISVVVAVVLILTLLSIIFTVLPLALNAVECHHAQQAAAIAECTMYNANSTDGSYCLV